MLPHHRQIHQAFANNRGLRLFRTDGVFKTTRAAFPSQPVCSTEYVVLPSRDRNGYMSAHSRGILTVGNLLGKLAGRQNAPVLQSTHIYPCSSSCMAD